MDLDIVPISPLNINSISTLPDLLPTLKLDSIVPGISLVNANLIALRIVLFPDPFLPNNPIIRLPSVLNSTFLCTPKFFNFNFLIIIKYPFL